MASSLEVKNNLLQMRYTRRLGLGLPRFMRIMIAHAGWHKPCIFKVQSRLFRSGLPQFQASAFGLQLKPQAAAHGLLQKEVKRNPVKQHEVQPKWTDSELEIQQVHKKLAHQPPAVVPKECGELKSIEDAPRSDEEQEGFGQRRMDCEGAVRGGTSAEIEEQSQPES